MKRMTLLAAALLLPAWSQAAPPQASGPRVGIGGSVVSDDTSIYLPIELSPAFRLEPFFDWSETESTTGGVTFSTESRSLGAGGFFRMEVHERVQTYLGGRLAYVETEFGTGDADGFSIAPTVGAEFWVTDRFTVALEAYLYHQEFDGNSGTAPTESEASGSDTRVLVRFFP